MPSSYNLPQAVQPDRAWAHTWPFDRAATGNLLQRFRKEALKSRAPWRSTRRWLKPKRTSGYRIMVLVFDRIEVLVKAAVRTCFRLS